MGVRGVRAFEGIRGEGAGLQEGLACGWRGEVVRRGEAWVDWGATRTSDGVVPLAVSSVA